MANCFKLRVMTAGGVLLESEAEYLGLQTSQGSVGILANHAPMLCALREGASVYRDADGAEKTIRHSQGVAEVRDNGVTILADHAEL